jgi:hypothetical protein
MSNRSQWLRRLFWRRETPDYRPALTRHRRVRSVASTALPDDHLCINRGEKAPRGATHLMIIFVRDDHLPGARAPTLLPPALPDGHLCINRFILQLGGLCLFTGGQDRALIGVLLIFASLPAFIWDCQNYAEGTGRSKWLGAVGVAGIIGLIIQRGSVSATRRSAPSATSRRFLLKLCHGTHSQLLHYRPY